jgi:16S rRNA (cytosine967-C5)-methyltransferase
MAEKSYGARETALKILHDIEVNNAYIKIAFDRNLKNAGATREDTAFITELVFGTVRLKLKLDYIIESFSKIRMERISPWILNILRLGVYQTLFTDKIPVSAAVNESVKLARRYGNKGSVGFVNAILRNIDRGRDQITYPDSKSDPVGYLSAMHSHPRWIVKRWLDRYGYSFTEDLLKSNNKKPDFTIRANTLKNDTATLARLLEERGYAVTPGRYVPEALVVEKPAGILETPEYKQGRFVVQDEGAMIIARYLNPEPGDSVIDICSAPGGKATHMAQIMGNDGSIRAWDIHDHRVDTLKWNIMRTDTSVINAELCDAAVLHNQYKCTADKVLADVPCSGLGIVRRQPDIKWARKEDEIGELCSLQYEMIKAAAAYLKPGGVMVYSTCTLEPEENEGVVNRFIDSNSEYSIEPAEWLIPVQLRDTIPGDGMVRLYPNMHAVDGFFMARIKRK